MSMAISMTTANVQRMLTVGFAGVAVLLLLGVA